MFIPIPNIGALRRTYFRKKIQHMAYDMTARWISKLAFDIQVENHLVRMDASVGGDDTGPSPKRLVLAGLIGCTGMDVVALLKKMRVDFTVLEINGIAQLTQEHPKTFSHIQLTYKLIGRDIKKSKVEKAVVLSQEKYCGVSEMLRKHCPIDLEIVIEEPENSAS